MSGMEIPLVILACLAAAMVVGLGLALVLIAIKVTGSLIAAFFWLVRHILEFVFGLIADACRIVVALAVIAFSLPFAVMSVVLAAWPNAKHWGRKIRREGVAVGERVWSALVRRPLRLLFLESVLDRVQRDSATSRLATDADASASEAVAAAWSAPDTAGPNGAVGSFGPLRGAPVQFDGYRIEGTLRAGGSGAKLYVAAPESAKRTRLHGHPERVVLKSFALAEGSTLPQIVRESRALDSARAMGLILDHGLDDRRFWYAMPYHPGDNLNEVARRLHDRSSSAGLGSSELRDAMTYACDLVATLSRYHEGGLWHKDVKPDNVIVHDGRAHLVDLGLVTPLRSAMTLTTHGTEYFRDPEMVRQALRGVRVHQVDGAKFDIYGAGAVLYYLLEGTFPAHGGLSSFAKESPEALRWIVRRAMADYHQRYGSAAVMLEDLAAVAKAPDPWSLRPIDLPSMRKADLGGAADFAAAGAPAGVGVGAGVGLGGGLGGAGAARRPAPPPPPRNPGRPRLRVTNWWTGAYASPDVAARVADAMSAAQAARTAVREHRRRKCGSKNSAVGGLVLAMSMIFATLMAFSFNSRSARRNPSVMASNSTSVEEQVVARSLPPETFLASAPGTRLVLVNNHPNAADAEVSDRIDAILAAYEKRGFTVVRGDADTAARISLTLAKSRAGEDVEPGVDLEAALAAGGYWGALHACATEGNSPSRDRLVVELLGKAPQEEIARLRSEEEASHPKSKSGSRSSRRSGRSMAVSPASAPVAAAAAHVRSTIERVRSDIRDYEVQFRRQAIAEVRVEPERAPSAVWTWQDGFRFPTMTSPN